MGLADLFGKDCVCPQCRRPGARKFMGKVKCRNMNCPAYDSEFAQSKGSSPGSEFRNSAPLPNFTGKFDPGPDRVEIRYRNFRGDEQTYVGDQRTLRRRGDRISLCLSPTGRRASFAVKWILSPTNLPDLAQASEVSGPTPQERRVLAYHRKRGTTSALYERLRLRFPHN